MDSYGYGSMIVTMFTQRKKAEECIENFIKIYASETDEKEITRLQGLIEALTDCLAFRKAKLFDTLQEQKDLINKIKQNPDEYIFDELYYHQGYADGIRRLIGIHREACMSNHNLFLVLFASDEYSSLTFSSALKINEKITGLTEYTGILDSEKNFYFISEEVDTIKALIDERLPEYEYILLLVSHRESTHKVKDIIKISQTYKDNFYFVNFNSTAADNTFDYIKKILKTIGMK